MILITFDVLGDFFLPLKKQKTNLKIFTKKDIQDIIEIL